MKKINLIYASNLNGVIGNKGTIPWNIPEDLQRFKQLTTGCHVVMGRKTWESLPASVRPLPGRTNIVISARNEQELRQVKGIEVYNSVQEVVDQDRWNTQTLWVIGGNSIYERFLPHADAVYKTLVEDKSDGDTLAPALDVSEWVLTRIDPSWSDSISGVRFRTMMYTRKLITE